MSKIAQENSEWWVMEKGPEFNSVPRIRRQLIPWCSVGQNEVHGLSSPLHLAGSGLAIPYDFRVRDVIRRNWRPRNPLVLAQVECHGLPRIRWNKQEPGVPWKAKRKQLVGLVCLRCNIKKLLHVSICHSEQGCHLIISDCDFADLEAAKPLSGFYLEKVQRDPTQSGPVSRTREISGWHRLWAGDCRRFPESPQPHSPTYPSQGCTSRAADALYQWQNLQTSTGNLERKRC